MLNRVYSVDRVNKNACITIRMTDIRLQHGYSLNTVLPTVASNNGPRLFINRGNNPYGQAALKMGCHIGHE